MLRLFLAHAKEDKDAVTQLYHRLKESGYRPWLDKEDLLPGQNWRAEIPKAIKNSQVFIACLSQQSVVKQGYVQREFKMALNEYADKPPGSIYLIPVRLDDCAIPALRQEEYGITLRDIQWVDLFETNGFGRLVKALQHGFPDSHSSPSPRPPAQTAASSKASPKATIKRSVGFAFSQSSRNLPDPPSNRIYPRIRATFHKEAPMQSTLRLTALKRVNGCPSCHHKND